MSANKHRARKRYLEPNAAPHECIPKSTLHRLMSKDSVDTAPSGTPIPSSSAGGASLPSTNPDGATQVRDSSDDADEDECNGSSSPSGAQPGGDRHFFEFATPLGNGTSLSVGDVLVLIMDYVIEEGLSWTSAEKLLKLQNKILGGSILPETKHLFRKFANAVPDDIAFHFYCPTCETFLERVAGSLQARQGISPTCPVCGERHTGRDLMAKGSYFVSLPLESQLASVLSDEDVREKLAESLKNVYAPRGAAKSDLTDGDSYRKQRAKLNCSRYDLTVSMNADGSPVFKSANYSIWPVQLTINELPPFLRWRSIVLPLLWYGTKHPNMTLLLEAFASQMKRLADEGITWSAAGETVRSKVSFCNFIFLSFCCHR